MMKGIKSNRVLVSWNEFRTGMFLWLFFVATISTGDLIIHLNLWLFIEGCHLFGKIAKHIREAGMSVRKYWKKR